MTTQADLNLEFLRLKGVDAGKDWLYQGATPISDHELHRRVEIVIGGYGRPDSAPAPLRLSSWADCREAGLVEYGWYKPAQYDFLTAKEKGALFYGIRLTPCGRDALQKTFGEQNVPPVGGGGLKVGGNSEI